jgi:hypothetical protein
MSEGGEARHEFGVGGQVEYSDADRPRRSLRAGRQRCGTRQRKRNHHAALVHGFV